MRKYGIGYPKHPILRQIIKFYWWVQSEKPVELHQALLPTLSYDVIFNFGDSLQYDCGSDTICPDWVHFSAIRNKPLHLHHSGMQNIIGISFFPTGLYPFLKIPMSEFQLCHGFSLKEVIGKKFSQFESLQEFCSVEKRIEKIESILIKIMGLDILGELQNNAIITNIYKVLTSNIRLSSYCNKIGITQQTLGRVFKKQVGVTPKSFLKYARFQNVFFDIKYRKYQTLTQLAYDHNYFDQNHFIKEFKLYAGTTPSKLTKESQIFVQLPDTAPKHSLSRKNLMFDFLEEDTIEEPCFR